MTASNEGRPGRARAPQRTGARRAAAALPAALLLGGVGLLGCPGTLAEKECHLQEQRAHALLSETCTSSACHNADEKVFGLDLETPGIGQRLRDKAAVDCEQKPLVVPGKPDESILYLKLFDPPPCGSRMPLGKPELAEEDIEILRAWIAGMDGSCAGAGPSGGGGGAGAAGGAGGAGGSQTTTSGTTAASGGAGGAGGAGGG